MFLVCYLSLKKSLKKVLNLIMLYVDVPLTNEMNKTGTGNNEWMTERAVHTFKRVIPKCSRRYDVSFQTTTTKRVDENFAWVLSSFSFIRFGPTTWAKQGSKKTKSQSENLQ